MQSAAHDPLRNNHAPGAGACVAQGDGSGAPGPIVPLMRLLHPSAPEMTTCISAARSDGGWGLQKCQFR